METVNGPSIYDQDRWHTYFAQVVRDQDTGKYYEVSWRSGSTEYQDLSFDGQYYEVHEVEPFQTTVTLYRRVKTDD